MRPSNNRATSSLPLHSPIPSTYGTCRVCARNEASDQGANLRFFFGSVRYSEDIEIDLMVELYESESAWEQMQAFVAEKLEETREGPAR